MSTTWGNRLKFAVAGDLLDAVNPFIPGSPHRRATTAVAHAHSVLELCTGTGYAARLLAREHPDADVVGVDLSPEMVAVGNRKLRTAGVRNVTLRVGDVAELPFADHTFDAVMAVFGLHEVPEATRRSAVSESARVLRPGGLFVTVDLDRPPAPAGLLADIYFAAMEPRHAKQVCGHGITSLLEESGFTIDCHTRARRFGMSQTVIARSAT
jgi:demethylmenaquinone methyltransferase/2-methoxy-6-polyprenyl-1,4-benzoquinol methylase